MCVKGSVLMARKWIVALCVFLCLSFVTSAGHEVVNIGAWDIEKRVDKSCVLGRDYSNAQGMFVFLIRSDRVATIVSFQDFTGDIYIDKNKWIPVRRLSPKLFVYRLNKRVIDSLKDADTFELTMATGEVIKLDLGDFSEAYDSLLHCRVGGMFI